MLAGVEILLERMKTNPEEFVEGGYSKWSRVLDSGWEIFTEEERTALQNAHKEAKRDHFNGEVMRVLAGDHYVDESVPMTDPNAVYKSKHLMQGNRSGLLASGHISTTNSNILTPATLHQQIKDTLNKQFDEAYARKDKYVMKTASELKGMMRK